MFSFNNPAQPQGSSQPQQQQQQQPTGFGSNQFSSPGPLSVNDLNRSQTGFGAQQQQGSLFGSVNQQPQQQQQQQQPSGFASQQPMFGASQPASLFGSQQNQQQPLQGNQFGQSNNTFSPFGQQQQQQPQSQAQQSIFGQPQLFQQPQQQQQQQPNQFGQSNPQQLQQQQFQQQQQPQQQHPQQPQQMSYVPGYLSRVRGDKPYRSPARQLEPGSPEATHREAESGSAFGTPASKSVKDDAGSQASPMGKFSSSFFDPRRDRASSVGPRGSIFGAGGLRGARETPSAKTPPPADTSFSPSRSFRAATSPPGSRSFAAAMDDDDDDAPPQDRLDDVKPSSPVGVPSNGFASFSASLSRPALTESPRTPAPSASNGGRTEALTGQAAVVDQAQRTVLLYGYPHWMEKAVLELFAALGEVESIEPIDITGSGAAQDQAAGAPFLPCCTRVRYALPHQALHALRRSGEVVAGACMVGVRWEDENLHQAAITGGADAAFRRDVFPSSRTAQFKASGKTIPVPAGVVATRPAAAAAAAPEPAAAKTPAPQASLQASTSAYGRPLSVVGDSASALKPSPSATASPFRVSLFGGSAGAKANESAGQATPSDKRASVMGRIADGIFGW